MSEINDIKIIKLGGSAVTDKSKDNSVNPEKIRMLAEAVSGFSKEFKIIIVHGAGSCGHPQAKEWGIQQGVSTENSRGIFETHEAVSGLNKVIVESLREAKTNAVGFHPFECAFARNGRLVFCGEEQIKKLVEVGVVPVLHGDVVTDEVRGACVVSGDQIAPYLAKAFKVKEIGIATEVGGVLEAGKVVPVISKRNISDITFGESGVADVTGGMKGKVEELLALADEGISSHIFSPEDLRSYLAGVLTKGTRIIK